MASLALLAEFFGKTRTKINHLFRHFVSRTTFHKAAIWSVARPWVVRVDGLAASWPDCANGLLVPVLALLGPSINQFASLMHRLIRLVRLT